jgi:hypothetical protein
MPIEQLGVWLDNVPQAAVREAAIRVDVG